MYILQKPTASKKACVSFLLVGEDIDYFLLTVSIGIWRCPFYHFIPKNGISCAGPLTLLPFMVKPAFKRIWTIISPFSKTSSMVSPHTVMSSKYCRCSGASCFPNTVWISPWQMVGLCFSQSIPGVLMPLQVKANSIAEGIKKSALARSVVTYQLAAFDSSWYRSSGMSSTAALSSGMTSFRPW